jgi:thioesterase domain-containing protein/acyl carrier protein
VLYPGRIPSISLLRELVRKHKVTTAWLTTSVFNAIVDEDPGALASLEQILVGGEKLSVSHIRRAWDYLPGVQITNAYGPTEATVFACSYRIPEKPDPADTSIPIGVPISNTRAYILDENMTPVSVGASGELHLGGPGIARGYRNRPDLTAERFIPDPFGRDPCLYKTGDLARWRSDGNIDFLGRIDTQVKLRGFRIELSEIEEVARAHEDVRDAVAVVSKQPNQEPFLSLFVLGKPDKQPSPDEVLHFLKGSLPEFMVPACCGWLGQWPLTSSGKIDRLALSTLKVQRTRPAQPKFARTTLEKTLAQIWEDLLNVRPVGIHENFMEIGGDSVLTIRLLAKIEETLGTRLPEVALWEAPTIEKLAELISHKSSTQKISYAMPVQPHGQESPFFCVGAGQLLRPLSIALGPTQPFFSVGIEPAACGALRPPYRLEQLASHLVTAILEKCPSGPYYLGGFCFDGLYAYEIARQLIQQGHQIGLLVLFETTSPSSVAKAGIESQCKRLLIRLKYRAHQLHHMNISDYLRHLADDWSQFCQRKWWDILPFLYSLNIAQASNTLPPVLYIAANTYKPQPISCPTVLFRGKQWPIASAGDPYMGWRDLLEGNCQTYEVPGDHTGIFGESNVTELAQKLKFLLHKESGRSLG